MQVSGGRRSNRLASALVLAFAACVFVPNLGRAQGTTADVEGTVKDESGGVLPGATVTITNVETGLKRIAVTSQTGRYRLQALPPGRYDLAITLDGFQTQIRKALVLEMGQVAGSDFALKIAGVSEAVVVTGESPLVETTRSTLGQVVETRQVENLPLNGRNFQDLATLVPGARPSPSVDTTKARGVFKAIAFGAQSGRMTNVSIDGGDISDTIVGSTVMGYPLEAIREFRVSTTRFTAEFGRSSTAAISVVTRSGSNDIRGSAYGFFRSKGLNWKNYFARDKPKPDFNRRQWGAMVGGPIVHDRTHYFAAYERLNENSFATVNTQGKFPQYDGSVKTPYRLDLVTSRIDHQLSGSQNIFVRYALHDDDQITNVGGYSPLEAGSTQTNRTHDSVFGHTWVLGARGLNEFRVHYGDFHNQEFAISDTPRMSWPNLNLGKNTLDPQAVRQRRLQLREDFSFFVPSWHGEHHLKAGTDISRIRFDSLFATTSGGQFQFRQSLPYTPANSATWPYRYNLGFGDPYMSDYVTWDLAFYAQDDWRPAPNLTINLGVRWEAETKNGGRLTNAFTPFKQGETQPDYNNWGPRVGFVWDPGSNRRLVIRGGYGIYYYLTILNAVLNSYLFDGQRYVTLAVDNTGRADFMTNPLGGKTPAEYNSTNPFNTRLIAPDYQTPYSQQASVGFSAQLTSDLGLDVDYVHILGLREATGRDINVVGTNGGQTTKDKFGIPIPRPYPQFRQVLQYETTGRSRYDGLHAALRKRFVRNYQFGVSYTMSWARGRLASGFGSTPNDMTNIDADWGYQSTDERHRVSVNGVVEAPGKIQFAPIVSFSTGRPYTLVRSGVDLNNDLRTGDREPGTKRNSQRAASQVRFDIRIARDIGLGRNRSVQLIFETFNVLNRANFTSYGSNTLDPSTLLKPYAADDPRQMQLGVRFGF